MHGWSRIELAPLLKRRVFSSTQPAETRERVSEALKEHRLTWKGGRVDAELNRARFGALSVCTLRYGAEVHIEPDRLQDFMLVQVPLRGRARIECGTDCVDAHPDCAAVIAPNRALKLHWEAGCEQLLLKIPRGKLEAIGHRIFGDAAARPLDFSPALRLDTPVGAAWRSMMTSLIHLLPTLDDGAPRPPAAWLEHLEDTLVLHLLYNQPNTWQRHAGLAPALPRRITQAEAYMRAHLAAPPDPDRHRPRRRRQPQRPHPPVPATPRDHPHAGATRPAPGRRPRKTATRRLRKRDRGGGIRRHQPPGPLLRVLPRPLRRTPPRNLPGRQIASHPAPCANPAAKGTESLT